MTYPLPKSLLEQGLGTPLPSRAPTATEKDWPTVLSRARDASQLARLSPSAIATTPHPGLSDLSSVEAPILPDNTDPGLSGSLVIEAPILPDVVTSQVLPPILQPLPQCRIYNILRLRSWPGHLDVHNAKLLRGVRVRQAEVLNEHYILKFECLKTQLWINTLESRIGTYGELPLDSHSRNLHKRKWLPWLHKDMAKTEEKFSSLLAEEDGLLEMFMEAERNGLGEAMGGLSRGAKPDTVQSDIAESPIDEHHSAISDTNVDNSAKCHGSAEPVILPANGDVQITPTLISKLYDANVIISDATTLDAPNYNETPVSKAKMSIRLVEESVAEPVVTVIEHIKVDQLNDATELHDAQPEVGEDHKN